MHTYIYIHNIHTLHTYLPTYLPTYIPTYLPTYLHAYMYTCACMRRQRPRRDGKIIQRAVEQLAAEVSLSKDGLAIRRVQARVFDRGFVKGEQNVKPLRRVCELMSCERTANEWQRAAGEPTTIIIMRRRRRIIIITIIHNNDDDDGNNNNNHNNNNRRRAAGERANAYDYYYYYYYYYY